MGKRNHLDNFIIAGNTGFIGQNLHYFLQKKYKKNKIFGFGSKKINLTKKKDIEKLKSRINSKTVIFFLSTNKEQAKASAKHFEINLNIINNLIEVLKKKKPKKLIFFSSQVIYGENTNNNFTTEKTLPNPTSLYGIAKYTSERLLLKAANDFEFDLMIVRMPRIYGPGDNPKNYGPTKFVNFFKNKQTLEVYGNGSEKRDFVHIIDLVKVLEKLYKKNYSGSVNICTGVPYSFKEVIKTIEKLVEQKMLVKYKKRTRPKVNHIMINKRLIKIIGKYNFINLKNGIKTLLNEKE